jgi:hypothetical protein
MAVLDTAIHAYRQTLIWKQWGRWRRVDARVKPAHDGKGKIAAPWSPPSFTYSFVPFPIGPGGRTRVPPSPAFGAGRRPALRALAPPRGGRGLD